MIRVAFDHRIFSQQLHGGVSRYFASMMQHLPEQRIAPVVIAPLHINDYLQSVPRDMVIGRRISDSRLNKRVATLAGDLLYWPLTKAQKPNIVHETYYSGRRRAPSSAALVITVHDMIHELFPEEFADNSTSVMKAAAIRRADWIVCVSESTRRDLMSFFPEAETRSSVIHLGFDQVEQTALEPNSQAQDVRPYILFVGQRAGYKNFAGLLRAFAASQRLRHEIAIICAGGGAFTSAERQMIADADLGCQISQATVSSRELQKLYRRASLLAWPSKYEGFGIPPLEAMAADCPVVAMRSSSVPEVCGNAAAYALVDDPGSLTRALEEVAFSTDTADFLRSAGRENIKRFSWAATAAGTAACYAGLV